jgi:hypothetical protein
MLLLEKPYQGLKTKGTLGYKAYLYHTELEVFPLSCTLARVILKRILSKIIYPLSHHIKSRDIPETAIYAERRIAFEYMRFTKGMTVLRQSIKGNSSEIVSVRWLRSQEGFH